MGRGRRVTDHGLVAQAAGVSEREQPESPLERQRAAIVRDQRIDYAILAFMALLATVLVVIAWLR